MKSRGIALIMVLLMITILLMLVGTLVSRARTGSLLMGLGRDDTQALLAAEAGIADAMSQLSQDNAWNTTTSNTIVPGSPDPRYTVSWAPGDSVNNLNGATAVDGPQGVGTVPPGVAYIVVVGSSRGRTRRLEACVARGGPLTLPQAMISGGNISLQGNVNISGVKTLEAPGGVSADIVSTGNGAGGTISLGASQPANVAGSIRTNGSTINLGSYANVTGTNTTGASSTPPVFIDVAGKVAAKSGATVPVFTPGTTVLGPGNYYLPSGASYSGDIVLNGAKLYSNGDLNLTSGSLKGRGSVYVNGKTSLYGNADIVAGDANGLALMSTGDISLKGLNGSTYMANVLPTMGMAPNGKTYVQNWTDAQNYIQGVYDATLAGPSVTADQTLPYYPGFVTNMGGLANIKKFGNGLVALGDGTSEADFYGDQIMDNNGPMVALATGLNAQPASLAQAFMLKKVQQIATGQNFSNAFFRIHSGAANASIDLNAFNTTGRMDGAMDAINDYYGTLNAATQTKYRTMLLNALAQIAFNDAGSATFNGAIYTQGNLKADDDLQITGAVSAGGNISLSNVTLTFVPNLVGQAGLSDSSMRWTMWLRP